MKPIQRDEMIIGGVYATVKYPTIALKLEKREAGELFFSTQQEHLYKEDAEGKIRFLDKGTGFMEYPTPAELAEFYEQEANGKARAGAEIKIGSNSPVDENLNPEAAAIAFLYQKGILDVRMMPAIIAGYHGVFGDKTSELLSFFTRNHPEIMKETLRQAFKCMFDDKDDD